MELDFLAERFSVNLEHELRTVDIALAADGKIVLFVSYSLRLNFSLK